MRLTLALSMIALLAVTMTIQAQSRSTNPVATIKQIQEAMISPSSDTIFNVGRAAPASDEEWLVVRNAAVILAEAGNLLMLEGRAKDTEQWMDLAGELVAAGNDALVAAESQDVAAVLDSGNRIAAACEACHQPYRDGGRAMGPKTVPDQPQR
jgi:cytochrome c553